MPSAPKWLFDAVDLIITKLSSITISNVQLLSASLKRISFAGDFSKINFPVGAYIDFRVNATDARRYTVSNVDIEKGILEIIVHLHGNGPGSNFMNGLRAGDVVDLNRPRSERNYYAKSAERLLIFGDETSLGLACAFLPELKKKKHQFLYYLELDEENWNIPEQLGLENFVVFPKNGYFKNETWLDQLAIFQSKAWQEAHYVLTGNASSAQAFKKAIKRNTKGKVFLHGYWLAGKKGL
ncbi:FAD-binding oxidoreductase [Pedobacter ureilyticus]|uniref:FAD-binding oxidoreductase n=1 Tax=Pedobacter ureilyticus TaxID=1393051 RepID=A0ABW9JBZ9_9SPHI|nr:FAD-binding oxidoreductase [Pedobacter helvus]